MTEEAHNGFTVRYYIKDRTVIEDTESSLDMRLHGWRLVELPRAAQLHATPPDFGALCVQRQRWAQRRPADAAAALSSSRDAQGRPLAPPGRARDVPAAQLPRVDQLGERRPLAAALLPVRPAAALALGRAHGGAVLRGDSRPTCIARGYKRRDVLRLYGLNIMLLPVNTAGAARSIGQAIGGQKSAFARTPKVKKRTVTPLAFVTFPFIISVWSSFTLVNDLAAHRYLHAAFSGVNARDHPVRDAEHARHARDDQRRRPRHPRLALRPGRRKGGEARARPTG